MNWLDLLFILLGLGLGLSGSWLFSNWLFSKPKPSQNSNQRISEGIDSGIDSEKEALQAQLRQLELAYQMAITLGQFKSGFLARVSHELRSPLNSLIGTHQLILADLCDDPAEEREFIQQAHNSALRMVKMIDTILEVAKTEYGTASINMQPVQLQRLLEEVHQLTYLQAQDRNLHLKLHLPAPDVYVLTDSRRLRQVLIYLLDTSITLLPEGAIEVSTQISPDADDIYIWIDNDLPLSIWSESPDLLKHGTPPLQTSRNLSAGMNLVLSQMILEQIQGRLQLIANGTESDRVQIQCSIPLAKPEVKLEAERIELENSRPGVDYEAPL